MTFERDLYDPAYYEGLHPHHWFKNPPRKYEERNRDVLRVVDPSPRDVVVELGSARGDVAFLLAAHAREVIGVDAAPEAIEMAERERARRGVANVRFLEADVADLSAIASGSVDAVAAIDLVEHVDDATLAAMLGECRRILGPGGRLGLYTPDRSHYVERMKAHDFVLKQFPQHIAVRRAEELRRILGRSGFGISLDTWSVSPFPVARWVERALAPLPLLGPTFRYRILLQGRVPLEPAGSRLPHRETDRTKGQDEVIKKPLDNSTPARLGIPGALVALALLSVPGPSLACTSILVTKGASADGSTHVTYAADSHDLYGELTFTPAGVHRPGTRRDIVEWDTGKLLGRIPEAPVTYQVVGNLNEHQVAIAESTWGGRKELKGPAGLIDYGSLIYIALERSRTAREAIRVMTDLVAEFGYASSGESFSIADPNEAWILDLVGKGEKQKGAVWVAQKVPDGTISAHANLPRVRRFPLNDPGSCVYARDVVSFAREKGWFTGADADFSFADVYAPVRGTQLRTCDGRVWSVFRRAAPSLDLSSDWIRGVKGASPLPFSVRPDRKLTLAGVMELMRDHFEGTELDMAKDVGAGPFALPYRWRPMTWKVDGQEYLHERAISTQQTGFSFVSQSRSWLPPAIGGVLWFGLDDTFSTVYAPMYCGIREVPRSYAVGTGSFGAFSWDSAFWVFSFVSNWAYSRYGDMIVDIQKVQRELEDRFLFDQPEVEKAALRLHSDSPALARDYLTQVSVRAGDGVVARWRKLGELLIWKYADGNVRDPQGNVTHPRYPDDWYRRIARERGELGKAPVLEGEKRPPE